LSVEIDLPDSLLKVLFTMKRKMKGKFLDIKFGLVSTLRKQNHLTFKSFLWKTKIKLWHNIEWMNDANLSNQSGLECSPKWNMDDKNDDEKTEKNRERSIRWWEKQAKRDDIACNNKKIEQKLLL